METTILGRTGMRVSRLCLGCMSYGTPEWRPWVLDENQARPFFKRALEAGINFFDTSDMYSLGVSEEVTGRMLREMGNLDECVIATNVFFPPRRCDRRQKCRAPETPAIEIPPRRMFQCVAGADSRAAARSEFLVG